MLCVAVVCAVLAVSCAVVVIVTVVAVVAVIVVVCAFSAGCCLRCVCGFGLWRHRVFVVAVLMLLQQLLL